jgi:carboxypeptidase PM20D1
MARMVKRGASVLLAALLILLLVVAFRTWTFGRSLPPPSDAPPPPAASADALARLSAAVRIPTVSHEGGVQDAAAFAAFADLLRQAYPRVHGALRREEVAGGSLLYTWPGADPSLAPVLLAAHIDVVPVEPGTEARWTHPPFSGAIADGFVWGRGAWDDKSGVMGIMEAAEALLAAGFAPRRTLIFAFGHDEEVGGEGARAMAALLRARGVRLAMVLDEGMLVADGIIAGAGRPAALIGVAEKGYASIELVARAQGGHSSMPTPDNAAARIARTVADLSDRPFPARLSPPVAAMFDAVGPTMRLPERAALANRWLTGRLLLRTLTAEPSTDASVRTTTAATILSAGTKDNVLPQEARAVINHRLLPGDTVAEVVARARRVAERRGVEVRLMDGAVEPSPVSPMAGPAWDVLAAAAGRAFPDAVVAPGLTVGATDARHYVGISDATYRFLPVRAGPDDLPRFHGTDERVSIADYGAAIAFYRMLMEGAQRLPAAR